MSSAQLCDSLTALMGREAALLEQMADHELVLKESIVAHNWARLELSRRKLAPILQAIAEVEQARHSGFSQLREAVGENAEAGFYEVLLHFDDERRERAAGSYRSLKLTVLKIQAVTNSIEVYLRAVTGTMQEILGELFPFRKGSIYTRKGTASQTQSNPMVFSRRL